MNMQRADISPKHLVDHLFLNVPMHLNHSYNHNGVDAFGNSRECYFYIPSWDEEDNPIDAGEQSYIQAANGYLEKLQRPERLISCSLDGELTYSQEDGKTVRYSLNTMQSTPKPDVVFDDIPY